MTLNVCDWWVSIRLSSKFNGRLLLITRHYHKITRYISLKMIPDMSSKHPSLSTQVLFSTTLSRTIIFHSWAQPILLGYNIRHKGKCAHEPRTQTAGAYPAFVSMKHAKEYCYSPLYGMLVHRRVTPQQYVAGTHLYTWVKRDQVE